LLGATGICVQISGILYFEQPIASGICVQMTKIISFD